MTAPAPLPIEIPAWKIKDLNMGGEQHIYRVTNGYGASVVRGPYTYGGTEGLFELGVIVFDDDTWELTYETPITSDVLGHLTLEEVAETLVQIAALPRPVTR